MRYPSVVRGNGEFAGVLQGKIGCERVEVSKENYQRRQAKRHPVGLPKQGSDNGARCRIVRKQEIERGVDKPSQPKQRKRGKENQAPSPARDRGELPKAAANPTEHRADLRLADPPRFACGARAACR